MLYLFWFWKVVKHVLVFWCDVLLLHLLSYKEMVKKGNNKQVYRSVNTVKDDFVDEQKGMV